MRKTTPRLGRSMKEFPVLSLAALFGILFVLINPLRADVPQASSATNKILLKYKETTQSLISLGVGITPQTVPFKKEPDMGKGTGKLVRGLLRFGNSDGNGMPFIWLRDSHTLILDLNRNEDLTDDTSNKFQASSHSDFFADFSSIHVPFLTSQGVCRILADLRFYTFGTQPTCTMSVRSFWEGKAVLGGQDAQVGIVLQELDGKFLLEKSQMVLRPWEKRSENFNVSMGSMDGFPFRKKLFLNGQAYQVDVAAESKNGEFVPSLQFTGQSVPLGDLLITGKHIQRLVLSGSSCLVILDRPAERVKVPAGEYTDRPGIILEQGGVKAMTDISGVTSTKGLTVATTAPATLAVGGPLTNSILISRHGQVLRMDYRLIGAGGAAYQLANQDRSKPPKYAVYKGDRAINTGTFEFG